MHVLLFIDEIENDSPNYRYRDDYVTAPVHIPVLIARIYCQVKANTNRDIYRSVPLPEAKLLAHDSGSSCNSTLHMCYAVCFTLV